ncbi:MAG: biotin--[acetyl-CoA-carboxylase] ligase [Candidatus Omnitrophota bacterium]
MRSSSKNPNPTDKRYLANHPNKTAIMRVFVKRPLMRLTMADLARLSGLSIEAVTEAISSLREDGILIKPYDLDRFYYEPCEEVLHPDAIAGNLSTRWWGSRIYCFDEISSTIDAAKTLMESGAVHGAVFAANHQMRGRGRQGRAWNSPKGKDLLLTFSLQLGEWEPPPSILSIYAAAAVARVFDTAYGIPCVIKWPNDLMAQGRKLGGVLVEKDFQCRTALVSLGLNVHSGPSDWPLECRETAVSLAMLKPEEWRRDLLLAQCGATWEALWEASQNDRGEAIRGYWRRYEISLGKKVRLLRLGREMMGVTQGIDELGRLLFTAEDGQRYSLLIEEVQQLRVLE